MLALHKVPETGKLHMAEWPSWSTVMEASYQWPWSTFSPTTALNSGSMFAFANAFLRFPRPLGFHHKDAVD